MTGGEHTGLPHVDPLIDVHLAEQTKLNAAIAVSQAEGVVTAVRQQDLLAMQQAARRRLAAAGVC